MRTKQILLYDGHRDSPRVMYEAAGGLRFTPEQKMLIDLIARLEKKMNEVIAAANHPNG